MESWWHNDKIKTWNSIVTTTYKKHDLLEYGIIKVSTDEPRIHWEGREKYACKWCLYKYTVKKLSKFLPA